MWANSDFSDRVQYKDGFRTGLIGTAEQIARRIVRLKSLGVNLALCGFLHFQEDVEQFGREILPRMQVLEAQGARQAA